MSAKTERRKWWVDVDLAFDDAEEGYCSITARHYHATEQGAVQCARHLNGCKQIYAETNGKPSRSRRVRG